MRLVVCLCLLAGIALAACQSQPSGRERSEPLQTVESVDLDRYLGRWFEIARYENRFERGCAGVTADYARREDGLISVTNTCYQDSLDGEIRTAEGRARVIDGSGNAKLEVSFFGPFWSDYWIIELDADYRWAVVSEPDGRFLWILAREPQMDSDTLEARLAFLQDTGFDTSMLLFPEQWERAEDARH